MDRMPDKIDGAGFVNDTQTGCILIVGVKVHREVYQETGYLCQGDTPDGLIACVDALMEMIQDMPVIKTGLLEADTILEKLGEDHPSEDMKRYGAMAVAALRQAFGEYLSRRSVE